MKYNEDKTIEYLLDLDGGRYMIDITLGLWVKFEINQVKPTQDRPHGIRYSLCLHDRHNQRIMGFDNAHAIEYGGKRNVAPKRIFDHYHSNKSDKGQPYHYENAAKLLEDFWNAVDKTINTIKEAKK